MQRDRTIGLLLIVSCLIVLPLYIVLIFPAEFIDFLGLPVNGDTGSAVRLYAGLVPVAVGLIALLIAGAWIGVSILTSRPRKEIHEPPKEP